jgi:CheY-like chemotaxis protein
MAQQAGKRVLIVDDNPAVRAAVVALLERDGFTVAEAADSRAALDLLHGGEPIGLVLLDLAMPGLDGWEFLRRRPADPAASAVPVVVLTSVGSQPEPEARALGACEFLTKPVEAYTLLDTVRRHC